MKSIQWVLISIFIIGKRTKWNRGVMKKNTREHNTYKEDKCCFTKLSVWVCACVCVYVHTRAYVFSSRLWWKLFTEHSPMWYPPWHLISLCLWPHPSPDPSHTNLLTVHLLCQPPRQASTQPLSSFSNIYSNVTLSARFSLVISYNITL